jgi:Magnesium chelatase, subunit ChlI
VHSAAGVPIGHGLVTQPPLRAPHHTASIVSLVGGGTAAMRPGEISLAQATVTLISHERDRLPTKTGANYRTQMPEGGFEFMYLRFDALEVRGQAVQVMIRFNEFGAAGWSCVASNQVGDEIFYVMQRPWSGGSVSH